jgi:hypothetical protein
MVGWRTREWWIDVIHWSNWECSILTLGLLRLPEEDIKMNNALVSIANTIKGSESNSYPPIPSRHIHTT